MALWRVLVRSREAQGSGLRAQPPRFSDSRRLSERSAQRARSEFAAQAGNPSIAGHPCAAG
ncbi:MAG: hypothetical protein ACLGII_01685, partial [Gammaproteobacteria bacterium]